jgi:membrane protease YdiL (CAAX protease family)
MSLNLSVEQEQVHPEPPQEAAAVLPRVPNLGHAVLFLLLAVVLLFAAQAIVLVAAGSIRDTDKMLAAVQNQRLQLVTMALAYGMTLVAAKFLFERMWDRPFLVGLAWNGAAARRWMWRLIPVGFGLGWAVQAAETLITIPGSIPMDDFFKNASVVWALTIFGTLLAPVCEEIAFRGFLFPAFAIAYDWLRLPRTPEGRAAWRSSDGLSVPALVFGGLVSSALFALIHAAQLGYTWAAVALLMAVALVLTWIRYRTRSVACGAVVHACYNLSVFVSLMISTGGYRHLDRIAH